MKVKINVTQQDIDSGTRLSECHCPVALAAHRALKQSVEVYDDYLFIFPNGGDCAEYKVYLPGEVKTFIKGFDRQYENIKPFEFEVKVQS